MGKLLPILPTLSNDYNPVSSKSMALDQFAQANDLALRPVLCFTANHSIFANSSST